jgi:hypothetical protein
MEWKPHRYGTGADLDLGIGKLMVEYEATLRLEPGAPRYNVFVFGKRLTARSESFEEGKARAIAIAKKWLSEAQDKLST